MHPKFSIEISTHVPKSYGFQGFCGSSGIFRGSKWVLAGFSRVEVGPRAFFAGRSGSSRVFRGSSGIYLAVPNFLIGRKNPNFPKETLGKLEV